MHMCLHASLRKWHLKVLTGSTWCLNCRFCLLACPCGGTDSLLWGRAAGVWYGSGLGLYQSEQSVTLGSTVAA